MDKKLTIWLLILISISVALFLFKPTSIKKIYNEKLQITTSFYPMYFFATQIGGDKADIINITPSGVEPHDYEPTTQQIVKINQSKMLVLNGGIVEVWGNKIKDQLQENNVLVVIAGENLMDKEFNAEGKKVLDPHVWLDPILAKKQVENIRKGFEKIDPKNALQYQTNAKKLEAELDQLDKDFKQGLNNCQKKSFITSHEAFGYLAARYGINQISISGISPEEEPSSQKLAEIANLVKKENIKVIFFESLVSPKLSETIAEETGAKTMALNPIEGLTEEEIKTGDNYLTVMRDNLFSLQTALQCSK